jgi:peroxiredoxin
MQPKAALACVALVGGLGLLAFRATPEVGIPDLKSGDKAPAFSASTLDGKAVSLAELAKSGPVYLYFIKSDCPINARALPHVKGVFGSYKNAPLVGVINEPSGAAKQWQNANGTSFRMVLDPEMKVIRSYQATASPWIIEVKKGGTIGKIWPGFSQTTLQELNQSIAVATGKPVAKLDFSSAPRGMRYG